MTELTAMRCCLLQLRLFSQGRLRHLVARFALSATPCSRFVLCRRRPSGRKAAAHAVCNGPPTLTMPAMLAACAYLRVHRPHSANFHRVYQVC